MLPSLAQLPVRIQRPSPAPAPIGTFIELALRNDTPASLETVAELECSICYSPLGPSDEWLVPCVNYHAFHHACFDNWVRQSAPMQGGVARVKCPDCMDVLPYPHGDIVRPHRDPPRATRAERDRLAAAADRRAEATDREKAIDLNLLDWWSTTLDDQTTAPSVVDPAPPLPRRIKLYPGTLTRVFELANDGVVETRRRDVVAERSRALYEAATALVKHTLYGPSGLALLEDLEAMEERQGPGRGWVPVLPSTELKAWIDEYRVAERERLEGNEAERAAAAVIRWRE